MFKLSLKLVSLILLLIVQIFSQDKRFLFEKGDLFGFINSEGTVVIQPTLTTRSSFVNGYSKQITHNWFDKDVSFINSNGEVAIATSHEDAGIFSEGLAKFRKAVFFTNRKWGFMDTAGTEKIAPLYSDVGNFYNGRAWVIVRPFFLPQLEPDKFGYINYAGELVISRRFDGAGDFSEYRAPVRIGNKKGFIDTTGTLVIPVMYDAAKNFTCGLAGVKKDSLWGFINRSGDVVLPFRYDEVRSFSENLALVKENGNWKFIDTSGTEAFQVTFQNALNFSEGVAAIQQNKLWGYINASGTVIIPPKFLEAAPFQGGLAMIETETEKGYIDPSGVFVWKTATVK